MQLYLSPLIELTKDLPKNTLQALSIILKESHHEVIRACHLVPLKTKDYLTNFFQRDRSLQFFPNLSEIGIQMKPSKKALRKTRAEKIDNPILHRTVSLMNFTILTN